MQNLIILVLLIISFGTSASERSVCSEISTTQKDLNICAGSENIESSERLDALLFELKGILPEEPEKHLVKSQEAWDEKVKNDCEIAAWYLDGGSARSMIVSSCYVSHTNNRIKELVNHLCHPMLSTCEAKIQYEKGL